VLPQAGVKLFKPYLSRTTIRLSLTKNFLFFPKNDSFGANQIFI
jgi:hypothetical protein